MPQDPEDTTAAFQRTTGMSGSLPAILAFVVLVACLAGAGEEFQVNSTVDGNQLTPSVAALPDGGYLVVWANDPGQIRARRIDPSGALGEEVVVGGPLTAPFAIKPAVAADSDGAALVAWTVLTPPYCGHIGGRTYDPEGTPGISELLIRDRYCEYSCEGATDPPAMSPPIASSVTSGEFVVSWGECEEYSYAWPHSPWCTVRNSEVRGSRLSTDGSELSTFVVTSNGYFACEQYDGYPAHSSGSTAGYSSLASRAGEFVVVWGQRNEEPSGYLTKIGRYDAQGVSLGQFVAHNLSWGHHDAAVTSDRIAVAGRPRMVGDVLGWIFQPDGTSVTPSFLVSSSYSKTNRVWGQPDCGFLVVHDAPYTASSAIWARAFTWDGSPLGEWEFQVNSYTLGAQSSPAIAGDLVVWQTDSSPDSDQSGTSIRARRLDNLWSSCRLLGWWQAEGNAADSSVNLNHGTLFGGVAFTPGNVGSAFLLDGVDDYILVPHSPSLDIGSGDFSITFWILTGQSSGWPGVLDKRASGPDRGYSVFLSNGRPGVQIADGVGWSNFTSSAHVDDSAPHFVAITVDRDSPSGGRIWVDRAQVLTFDPTGLAGSLSNSEALVMGRIGDPHGAGGFLAAALDEVRLYGRSLTPQEVAEAFVPLGSWGALFADGFETGDTSAWAFEQP